MQLRGTGTDGLPSPNAQSLSKSRSSSAEELIDLLMAKQPSKQLQSMYVSAVPGAAPPPRTGQKASERCTEFLAFADSALPPPRVKRRFLFRELSRVSVRRKTT